MSGAPRVVDLEQASVRELNQALHALTPDSNETFWRVCNPRGRHDLAVGLDAAVTVEIAGHAGYYCAGMNKQAKVIVHGNAGVGVAENMMSGLRACARRCQPVRRGHRAWRHAADRRQRRGALCHLAEGR